MTKWKRMPVVEQQRVRNELAQRRCKMCGARLEPYRRKDSIVPICPACGTIYDCLFDDMQVIGVIAG